MRRHVAHALAIDPDLTLVAQPGAIFIPGSEIAALTPDCGAQ
jgi:hypothetical protein